MTTMTTMTIDDDGGDAGLVVVVAVAVVVAAVETVNRGCLLPMTRFWPDPDPIVTRS